MNVLTPVEVSVATRLEAAGFAPMDRVLDRDLAWLGYRASDADGPVLLDVFHLPSLGTITAELWRPRRLVQALLAAGPERVAERRRAWHYANQSDLDDLGREVAEAIVAWLADRDGSPVQSVEPLDAHPDPGRAHARPQRSPCLSPRSVQYPGRV